MTFDKNATILLVDDNPKNLELLFTTLRKAGYEVLIAREGERACRQINLLKPDLILMDIKLPAMNGFETAQCIRSIQDHQDIPIIFLSSLHDIDSKAKAFEVGGVDYITKPLQVDEVLIRIETQLSLKRLQKQVLANTILETRHQLARDLHDSVSQNLYSLTMHTQAATRALHAGKTDVALTNLQAVTEAVKGAKRDMRLLIYQLRPPILEQAGLIAALVDRLNFVEQRAGLTANLTSNGERRIASETELEIYRIIQEGLNNVLKHAQAKTIALDLTYTDDDLTVTLTDDGIGFDISTMQGRGFGLQTMRERAAVLPATIQVNSQPNVGTTIVLNVKL